LSLWFALHVIFSRVETVRYGPLRLFMPQLSSFDLEAALLAVLAAIFLLGMRLGVLATLTVTAGAALAFHVLAGA